MGNGENDFRRDGAMPRVAAKEDMPIPPPIFGSGLSRIFGTSRSGIGLRLLAGVLLFSSFVTLALTANHIEGPVERLAVMAEVHGGAMDAFGNGVPAFTGVGNITTGGTGITSRDGTYEAVQALLEKHLDGFGELFRMLSFQDIGSAAMMSRATAGTANGKAVFVLPGSPGAVRLAMTRLILPELGHVVQQLRR